MRRDIELPMVTHELEFVGRDLISSMSRRALSSSVENSAGSAAVTGSTNWVMKRYPVNARNWFVEGEGTRTPRGPQPSRQRPDRARGSERVRSRFA
jgi:hypothetical protein